jgi:hypothetical protein
MPTEHQQIEINELRTRLARLASTVGNPPPVLSFTKLQLLNCVFLDNRKQKYWVLSTRGDVAAKNRVTLRSARY